MKTLADLTPEIKAKIPIYKEKCRKDLYSGVEYENFDLKQTTDYIHKIYEISKFEKPVVIIAHDPLDYKEKFEQIKDKKYLGELYLQYCELNNIEDKTIPEFEDVNYQNKSHYLFLCSSYHRVYLTWYKFIQDEFQIEHKNKEILNWLYDHANNNIARCFFTKLFVLVLRMPKRIHRNAIGFHNVDGPAIHWGEKYGMYYINGRKIDQDLFLKTINKTLTFDEFIAIDDENTKGSLITLIKEKFGNEYLMKFLNATVVDEDTITHSSGHIETVKLWKTKLKYSFLADINGEMDQPYTWLELTCPSTDTLFLIDTSSHFTKAIDACKFHRPAQIPVDLKYDFNSFNN